MTPTVSVCTRCTRLITALALALFVLATPAQALADGHGGKKIKVGLAAGLGELDDDSFNEMQRAGLVLAAKAYDIEYIVEPPSRPEHIPATIEDLLYKDCNVVICGGGYLMVDILLEAAARRPDTTFVLLDAPLPQYPPNAASVTFRQNEASYLAGALASATTKTCKIAFLGASDLPIIRDFYVGYKAGARHVNPDVETEERYIGDLAGNFNPYLSPLKARSLANDIYEHGADIIFAVAAGSNMGVFSGARERPGAFAIGVDSDQDHMARGHILTSVMKRMDHAILRVIGLLRVGRLENRNYSMGLLEGGVSLSPMTYTRKLIPPEVLRTVERIKREILRGELKVPSAVDY